MMTRINEIWNELENDKYLTNSLLLRRYSANTLPDVYVAFQRPEFIRCIAFRIQKTNNFNVSRYITLKDIKISLVPDDNDYTRSFLLIALSNKEHIEVFSTLAEDLINQIASTTEDNKLIKEVLNRFEKWNALFNKATLDGLSPEEQRGLYGELYFLRKWIAGSSNLGECIQSWLGPEKELRDFQSGGWALEVKTTHGNNHQKIHISSERQLDTTNLNTLILYHISLESQQQHGETLNEIVNSLLEQLSIDVSAQIQFKSKLLLGGYFFHHTPKYENRGYQIRHESYYDVREGFPRISESDIPRGVGDVKYSIIITEHPDYIVTESFVLEIIK